MKSKKKEHKKETAPTDVATARKVKDNAPSVGYNWFDGFFKNQTPVTKENSKKKV